MTAKEKALQLYQQYKEVLMVEHDMRQGANPFAKACALIVTETLIEFINDNATGFDIGPAMNHDDYWQEVKKEIEEL